MLAVFPYTPLQYKRFNQTYCDGSDSCANVTVPLTASWISDGKDSAILPTRGAFQKLAFKVSPLGDLKYFKTTYQQQRFYSIAKGLTLMLNGELGYAKGLSGKEMPFYKNFMPVADHQCEVMRRQLGAVRNRRRI